MTNKEKIRIFRFLADRRDMMIRNMEKVSKHDNTEDYYYYKGKADCYHELMANIVYNNHIIGE